MYGRFNHTAGMVPVTGTVAVAVGDMRLLWLAATALAIITAVRAFMSVLPKRES
jgi:hypothetical protein